MVKPNSRRKAHLLGLGLDSQDGHTRITRGDNFTVAQGSAETHERMTEFCIKINEKMKRKGRALEEISPREFRDLASDLGC